MAEQKEGSLRDWTVDSWRSREAKQQPNYKDAGAKDAAIKKGTPFFLVFGIFIRRILFLRETKRQSQE